MIQSVTLTRFKKFKEGTVYLKPFSILMGENSCGKTTVLQAINLSLSTFATSDLIYERNGIVQVKNRGVGARFLPGINISDFRELYYAKVSRQGRQTKIGDPKMGAHIALVDDAKNVYRLQISSLFGGYNLKCLSTEQELGNDPAEYQYAPLFISGFVGLQETEQRSFPVTIRHHMSSGNVSSIIRNLVLDLRKNNYDNYKLMSERLVHDFGFYLDAVEFDEQSDEYVKAFYRENCEDKRLSLDFNSSGSGYMQILQILAPIYSVCPASCKVVLLDEPDAHLHPNMQIALARSLKRIQQELNIQIIISTHSPAIIKTAQPSEVIPISTTHEINKPLTTGIEVEESIAQIDNYELAKTVISGKMVFVEDANTDILEAFDKVANSKVFLGANTVSVHTGRSKDDKLPFTIGPLLKEFLGKEIEVYFIRDSDGLNDLWRDSLLQYATTKGITLHLLSHYEIENYILKPSLIHRALEKKYPESASIPTEDIIEGKIVEFLRNTIVMARFKYDDTLEDSIYKAAMLLNKSEYRSQNKVKEDAENIRSTYESLTTLDDLLKYGMGKEALSLLLKWLNDEIHMNLCKNDILETLRYEDVPSEIVTLLQKLQSEGAMCEFDMATLPPFESRDESTENDERNLEEIENEEMALSI